MTDKKYNSAKQYLKRNKKAIRAFEKLPTEVLAKVATGETDALSIATLVLNNRMPLQVTKKGDTRIKTNGGLL